MIQFIKKNQKYYAKVFLEKYNFNKDKAIYSNGSYYVDFDEEYYNGKCSFISKNNKKNMMKSFNEKKYNFFFSSLRL